MMNWKPGDRALLARSGRCNEKDLLSLVGEIVVLVSRATKYGNDCWLLDIKCHRGENVYARENILVPIDDGNEKSTWQDCVWKPEVIRET